MPSRSHSKSRHTAGPDVWPSPVDERNELMRIVLGALSPLDREVLVRFYLREQPICGNQRRTGCASLF
jgi:hypothetical protein